MTSLAALRNYFGVSLLITLFLLCGFGAALAQEGPGDAPPPFSAQDIEARIAAVSTNSELSSDQQAQIKAALEITRDKLADATRQMERSAQYAATIENAADTQTQLDTDLSEAEAALEAEKEPMEVMIGDDALLELEQELFEKESDPRATRKPSVGAAGDAQIFCAAPKQCAARINGSKGGAYGAADPAEYIGAG